MRAEMSEAPVEEIETVDPVQAAIAWHEGDVRAALASVLEDCLYLRQQLALTERAMSRGMTRGWKPTYGQD